MATIPVNTANNAGATWSVLTPPTATTGDTFANDGATKLYVKNASGGSITVTVKSPNTCSFGVTNNAAHDIVVTVAAGAEKFIGPFVTDRFNDAGGLVTVICSSVTSITVAATK